jgi:hypothetical protein
VTAEEPLRFPFDRDDFRHVLVRREGDVCLVERINLRVDPPSVHWEVILVQHRAAETSQRGREYPAREVYPNNEQWGDAGWTFTERSLADAKMAELTHHRGRHATAPPPLGVRHGGGSGA